MNEKLPQQQTPEVKQPEITPLKPEVSQEVSKETSQKLMILKQAIETGKFNYEYTKELIAELKDVEPAGKPYVLSMILSGINKEGIRLKKVGDKEIYLESDSKNTDKLTMFQLYLNHGLVNGFFSIQDFNNALIYRTSLTDEMLKNSDGSEKTHEELSKLTPKDLFIKLVKKHDIHFGSGFDFENQKVDDIEKLKKDITFRVKDSQADKDFMVAYIDDTFGKNGELFSKEVFLGYKESKTKNLERLNDEITKLDEVTKKRLGVTSTEEITDQYEQIIKDPSGFIVEKSGDPKSRLVGLVLGAIGLKFFGKKGGILGFLGGFLGSGAIGGLINKGMNLGAETIATAVNNNESTEGRSNIFKDIPKIAFEDKRIESMYNLESSNDLFLTTDISLLYVFDLEHPNDIVKELRKVFGDGVNLDNYKDYQKMFEGIIHHKKLQGINLPAKGTKLRIGDFLESTSNSGGLGIISSAHAGSGVGFSEVVSNPQNTPTTVNAPAETNNQQSALDALKSLSKDEIFKMLDKSFSNFKIMINSFEEMQNWHGGLSDELKKENNIKLIDSYKLISQYIFILENTPDLTIEEKNKLDEFKIYIAEYLSDNGEIENDFNKNYELGNKLALELLPNLNHNNIPKPVFPNQFEIAAKLRGQTGVTQYVLGEAEKGRDIDEILFDTQINELVVSAHGELVTAYERQLELYLDGFNENDLSKNELRALNLVKENQGIGWFDLKETNFDLTKNVGGTLASIGAGIGVGFGAGALAGSWTGPGTLLTGTIGAISGGIVTTAGIMITSGSDYYEDWDKGLEELALNSATFGAGGLLFKGGKLIQGSNTLFTSARGWASLGFEATGDVGIGAINDFVRSNGEIEITQAIENNLIWALLPIAFRGMPEVKFHSNQAYNFTKERISLGWEAAKKMKAAEWLAKAGDEPGANKLLRALSEKIGRARKTEVTFYRNPQSGETYRKTSDGKFYNSKGKLVISNGGKPSTAEGVELELVEIQNPHLGIDGYSNFLKERSIVISRSKLVISRIKLRAMAGLKNEGDSMNIGNTTIQKVKGGYTLNGDNSIIYKNISEVLENGIRQSNFLNYGKENILKLLSGNKKEIKLKLSDGNNYTIKEGGLYIEEKGVFRLVDDSTKNSLINDNYELLFKKAQKENPIRINEVSKKIEATTTQVQNIKLTDFFHTEGMKKIRDKFDQLASVKKPDGSSKSTLGNLTIREFLTLPKIASQVSRFIEKPGNDQFKAILKTIAYGDKDRSFIDGAGRLLTIGTLVSFDGLYGDSNDSELVDFAQYMTLGTTTQALNTLFDVIGNE